MKKLVRVILGVVLGAGLLAISAVDSSAVLVPFSQITSNSGSNYAADFFVNVTEPGSGQVSFVFSNANLVGGAISEVYFDNRGGALTTFASYVGTSAGVLFTTPAIPANLPAGNGLSPQFVSDFSFQATGEGSEKSANRVDYGETLGLIFNGSYDSVISGLSDGQLRIGLHVQSLNGFSESFVTPIPGALLLFGSGLVGLVGIGRRKVRT